MALVSWVRQECPTYHGKMLDFLRGCHPYLAAGFLGSGDALLDRVTVDLHKYWALFGRRVAGYDDAR